MQWDKSEEVGTSVRVIKRFALFPTEVGDKNVWLESYYVRQGWWSGGWDSPNCWHDLQKSFDRDYLVNLEV